jgi:hypothetical protein
MQKKNSSIFSVIKKTTKIHFLWNRDLGEKETSSIQYFCLLVRSKQRYLLLCKPAEVHSNMLSNMSQQKKKKPMNYTAIEQR